jgi:DNA-binding NarL/FixJ family response regulator
VIRVLLVDDHPALAEGMERLLSEERGIAVVGVASDAERALELATRVEPTLAVLDIDLPGRDGLAIGRGLLALRPELKLLYFSLYANPIFVLRAIEVGARGYLLKEEPAHAVAVAIRAVAAGETHFSPPIRRIAVAMGCVTGVPADQVLTGRERDVVKLIGAGQTLAQTAAALGIGRGSVRCLWERAQDKLGLRSLGVGLFTASLTDI